MSSSSASKFLGILFLELPLCNICWRVFSRLQIKLSLLQRSAPSWTSQYATSLTFRCRLTKLPRRPTSNLSTADPFLSLTLLAEILSAKPLPGSLDLISRLLDTLNSVLHFEPPAQGDKSYVEQLLMSAVESAAEKVAVSLSCIM